MFLKLFNSCFHLDCEYVVSLVNYVLEDGFIIPIATTYFLTHLFSFLSSIYQPRSWKYSHHNPFNHLYPYGSWKLLSQSSNIKTSPHTKPTTASALHSNTSFRVTPSGHRNLGSTPIKAGVVKRIGSCSVHRKDVFQSFKEWLGLPEICPVLPLFSRSVC